MKDLRSDPLVAKELQQLSPEQKLGFVEKQEMLARKQKKTKSKMQDEEETAPLWEVTPEQQAHNRVYLRAFCTEDELFSNLKGLPLAPQITGDDRQQARIPDAMAHAFDAKANAKKLSQHREPGQATPGAFRSGGPDNDGLATVYEEPPPAPLSDGVDCVTTKEQHEANKQIDSSLVIVPDDPPPMSSSGVQEIKNFDANKVTPPTSSAAAYDEEAPPALPPREPRSGAENIAGPFATRNYRSGTIVIDEPELSNTELVQDTTVGAVPISNDGHTHEYKGLQRDYRKMWVVVAVILFIVLIGGVVAGVVVGNQQGDDECVVSMDITCTDSLSRDCASISVPERRCRFRPQVLYFQYDGGTCPLPGGARAPSLIECVDAQDGSTERNGEEVYIVARDLKTNSVIRDQSVSVGGEFSVFCDNSNATSINVYSIRERDRLLQRFVYQCDCSKSLSLKDRLGSFELVSFTTELQGIVQQRDLINITYTFTVLNEGSEHITLTNTKSTSRLTGDLRLSAEIIGETLLSPESSKHFSRIVEIDLSSRQNYIMSSTVSALSSTGNACSDTATHVFEAGLPGPTFSPTILPASETPSSDQPAVAPVTTNAPTAFTTTAPVLSIPVLFTITPPPAPLSGHFLPPPTFDVQAPTTNAPTAFTTTTPVLTIPLLSIITPPPTSRPGHVLPPPTFDVQTPNGDACILGFKIDCFLSDGSQKCSSVSPVRTLCKDRPFAITFRFNAGGCSQSLNDQDNSNFQCMDFRGGPTVSGLEVYYLVAYDVEAGLVYHEGYVNVGDQFTILNGDKLGANTNITVYSSAEDASNSENILQTLVFHTSCSQPSLALSDRYGSVQVIVYANDLQGSVNSFAEVTLSYSISNPNEVDISLASISSNNSLPRAFTGIRDLDGIVIMPGEDFLLKDISFIDLSIGNRYTVLGSTEALLVNGFGGCRATASSEILVGV